MSGGGVTYDTGNHLIDGLLWTTGLTPIAVSAEMDFEDDAKRVDGAASISVRFENGIVGSIGISGRTASFSESIQIWADRDSVRFDENRITVFEEDGTFHPEIERHRELNKVEAFLDALESGDTPLATARDSYRAIALTEAAYKAAQTGERMSADLN